ncbi:MAG: tetratricopeptide repeat protein [Pirellulales bacterium]
MAVPIEGFSVVAQRDRIQHLLDDGQFVAPNATALADDHLWRCSFMVREDAAKCLSTLQDLGVNCNQGPDSDAVVINEFDRAIEPYCEWLMIATWDKAVIGWLAGTEPRSVIARDGWDPSVGSGLTFHGGQNDDRLELLRVEGNIEVFRDKESGREVYTGRSTAPVQSLFGAASSIVTKYWRSDHESPLVGDAVGELQQAIEMLNRVIDEAPQFWEAHLYKGKASSALGDVEGAYNAFRRSHELEPNERLILQELAGVCLELGKFTEAVDHAQQAVAFQPDNHELIGNLALAQLLAGNIAAAQNSINAALKLGPNDQITSDVGELIRDVASNQRPLPQSLIEAQSPPKQKTSFWRFWK